MEAIGCGNRTLFYRVSSANFEIFGPASQDFQKNLFQLHGLRGSPFALSKKGSRGFQMRPPQKSRIDNFPMQIQNPADKEGRFGMMQ